jgi:nucleoside-diphosphate-sugar epimerase
MTTSEKRHDRIEGCRVCVVGGAGFLGSHLVDHLTKDRGCEVLVLDNLCVGRLEFLPKNGVEFHHADIAQSEGHLYRLFLKWEPRWVFNYASWPYIPDSFDRPLHVFQVNCTGAIHVIHAAMEAGVHGVLQVSSAELYGESYGDETASDKIPVREDAPVRPHSSYGAAKAAVDAYVQVRWREAATRCIALRQFNCLGERETHPYVVPEIVSQLYAHPEAPPKEHVIRLGNDTLRDFMYAGDAVRYAVALLEKGHWGEVYNLGSEEGVKVYDLAKMVGRAAGCELVRVEQDPCRVRPWEIWHLQSDNTKIHSVVNYRPQVSFQEALRRTVRWYEGNGRRWPWEGASCPSSYAEDKR